MYLLMIHYVLFIELLYFVKDILEAYKRKYKNIISIKLIIIRVIHLLTSNKVF